MEIDVRKIIHTAYNTNKVEMLYIQSSDKWLALNHDDIQLQGE